MIDPALPLSPRLPAVHRLLEHPAAQEMQQMFPRARVRDAVRERLERERTARRAQAAGPEDAAFDEDAFLDAVRRRLAADDLKRLQRAINATGIVIHTNMGRAPLADAARAAVLDVTQGYSNLEMDLASGRRGGRGGETGSLLCRLTGAEAALVVNNNAAAVLLALAALAPGGEVVISRGELVEIGGGFRIPDVITQSGARLVEVGTTNKTRLADYARALTDNTRVLLKVHASCYRIVGFTGDVSVADLAALGREGGIPVMQDLGSGALVDLSRYNLPAEPTVGDAVRQGADIVACSGDKLLGGPQCGLLVGRRLWIERMGSHPLFRAVRADKMTLAALEATLRLYEEGRAADDVPVLRMLAQTPHMLARRARRLRAALAKCPGLDARVQDGVGFSGGGTLPEEVLPTKQVVVRPASLAVDCLADALRRGRPPIIGMVAGGRYVLDVRTLTDSDVGGIARAFARVFPG